MGRWDVITVDQLWEKLEAQSIWACQEGKGFQPLLDLFNLFHYGTQKFIMGRKKLFCITRPWL